MSRKYFAKFGLQSHNFCVWLGSSLLVCSLLVQVFGDFSPYHWISWVSLLIGAGITWILTEKSQKSVENALQIEKDKVE